MSPSVFDSAAFSCAVQCTWGRETAKKARTQQHFESLVNHIKSLEARVKELEAEVSQSSRSSQAHTGRSGSVSDAARSAGSSSLSPHPRSPVTKFEPDDDTILNGENGLDSLSDSDEDSEIEQLIAPTRHLVVSNPYPHVVFGCCARLLAIIAHPSTSYMKPLITSLLLATRAYIPTLLFGFHCFGSLHLLLPRLMCTRTSKT